MSETHSTSAGHSLEYANPYLQQGQGTLVQIGGGMGIAGGILGMLLFFAACFGFEAAFMFSPICLLLGTVGLVLSIVGGACKHAGVDDTAVLAAVMINFVVVVGGLLLLAAWLRLPLLGKPGM